MQKVAVLGLCAPDGERPEAVHNNKRLHILFSPANLVTYWLDARALHHKFPQVDIRIRGDAHMHMFLGHPDRGAVDLKLRPVLLVARGQTKLHALPNLARVYQSLQTRASLRRDQTGRLEVDRRRKMVREPLMRILELSRRTRRELGELFVRLHLALAPSSGSLRPKPPVV